jgi:hypothetical protein
MLHVLEAKWLGDSRVRLRFDDGVAGDLDVRRVVPFDGTFAPLNDPAFFGQVYVDPSWGTLNWPGDLDLAPEALWESVTGRKVR